MRAELHPLRVNIRSFACGLGLIDISHGWGRQHVPSLPLSSAPLSPIIRRAASPYGCVHCARDVKDLYVYFNYLRVVDDLSWGMR
ncbi:hypothetical protein VTO42DRAFT_643 [Malbranchea cinnamomea]